MPDAENQTYSPRRVEDFTTDPLTTSDALDELASRSQGGPYDASHSTGAQTINRSAATVNTNTERTNSDSSMFSLASDVLTVSLIGGGTIDLSYRSTIGNTGSDDFGFDVFVEQAPASTGTFAEVTGSRIKAGKGT